MNTFWWNLPIDELEKMADKDGVVRKKKKDNSKRNDEFTHCRCCGEYIYNQRSTSDKRYCMDCG
jgi:acetyl-CoA carboxylase beta subunit